MNKTFSLSATWYAPNYPITYSKIIALFNSANSKIERKLRHVCCILKFPLELQGQLTSSCVSSGDLGMTVHINPNYKHKNELAFIIAC